MERILKWNVKNQLIKRTVIVPTSPVVEKGSVVIVLPTIESEMSFQPAILLQNKSEPGIDRFRILRKVNHEII